MRELFVYYRVRETDAHAARAAVLGFQDRLRVRHPELSARLLRRPGAIDGRETWMETYAADPRQGLGGVDVELQAAIEAEAAAVLQPWLDGPRHTEVFTASVA